MGKQSSSVYSAGNAPTAFRTFANEAGMEKLLVSCSCHSAERLHETSQEHIQRSKLQMCYDPVVAAAIRSGKRRDNHDVMKA
jgi:hypothetical protein